MSVAVARKKRAALYVSILGLLVMVATVSAVSIDDPDGMWLRVGMIMMTVGIAMWLSWRPLIPATLAIWLIPNYVRSLIEDTTLFSGPMLYELAPIIGLMVFATLARQSLKELEAEQLVLGAGSESFVGLDPATGLLQASRLHSAIEAELVRSRRFSRSFGLVLVGVDELRQRFDYRSDEAWDQSVIATSQILRSTRMHIDRAFVYGPASFALLLPESNEKEVRGLVKRLRRLASQSNPAEGEPGGPLATHYGATFFPQCATTVDDLVRRAELALKLAEKNPARLYIDGAEALEMAPPETLRAGQITEPTTELEIHVVEEAEGPPISVAIAGTTPPTLEIIEEVPANVVALRETQVIAVTAQASPPPVLEAVPQPDRATEAQAEAIAQLEEQAPLDPRVEEDVNEVLKHLDETLDFIRNMRTGTH